MSESILLDTKVENQEKYNSAVEYITTNAENYCKEGKECLDLDLMNQILYSEFTHSLICVVALLTLSLAGMFLSRYFYKVYERNNFIGDYIVGSWITFVCSCVAFMISFFHIYSMILVVVSPKLVILKYLESSF